MFLSKISLEEAKSYMKVLFIGDIVGEPGRETLKKVLEKIREEKLIDFVIANGENSAGGKGITPKVADEIFASGVDVITLGNHTWQRKEVISIIEHANILRPANYPKGVPGKGFNIYRKDKYEICVINLMGRVYMPILDCPFQTVDNILKNISNKIIIVDFHAEITSEKQAMGWYLAGKVSAVIGTHTHVQTADEKILAGGTAYITDCGMVGPSEGVIGMDRDIILKRYLMGLPQKFEVAKGKTIFNSVVIEIDEVTGKALSIERLNR